MQDLILTLHIIVCVLLVVLILLQSGKEGMGVIFGGGNSSVFGSSGAGGILAKLTTLMAIIFVITSLSYTYVTSARPTTESTILNVQIEDAPPPATEPAAQPETPAATGSTAQPGAATEPPAADGSKVPSATEPAAQPAQPQTAPGAGEGQPAAAGESDAAPKPGQKGAK